MTTHNLPERMRSAKRSIYSIRTGGEVHVPPFYSTPDSKDRVVALRKVPLSRMFLLLVMILGFVFILYNTAAARECYGPVTGEVYNSNYKFTFESWMKKRSKDDVTVYRFERCVQNNHARELWVEWESAGLKGTCDANDIAYVLFDEDEDLKKKIYRRFWYGPSPEELDVSTILRPNEVDAAWSNDGKLFLAQHNSTVKLATLFSNQQSMKDVLDELYDEGKKEGFALWSAGRIGVPTRDDSLERLKEGRRNIKPGDFVSVEIWLKEQFILINDEPTSKLLMSIHIDEQGLAAMNYIGGSLPSLHVESDNNLLNGRLLTMQSITLDKHKPYLEFQDQSPTKLSFPVHRISGRVKFTFGDNDESHLIIPFGVTSSI